MSYALIIKIPYKSLDSKIFLKIYLFERKTKGRDLSLIFWFIPEMTTIARAGYGHGRELGTPSRSPHVGGGDSAT